MNALLFEQQVNVIQKLIKSMKHSAIVLDVTSDRKIENYSKSIKTISHKLLFLILLVQLIFLLP